MIETEDTGTTLRRYAEAWSAGDVPALLAAYSDDVVFHYFGRTDLAGTYEGKDACIGALMTASQRAARTLISIVDVLAGEQMGAIVVNERLTRGIEALEVQRVFLYRVQDGRITECWVHDQDQRTIDEFWKSE